MYWPARKGYGWSGRTVSTAMSGVRRSCETTSACHQAGLFTSSSAAASIMVWDITVYARTHAACVSGPQVCCAYRDSAPMRASPTTG